MLRRPKGQLQGPWRAFGHWHWRAAAAAAGPAADTAATAAASLLVHAVDSVSTDSVDVGPSDRVRASDRGRGSVGLSQLGSARDRIGLVLVLKVLNGYLGTCEFKYLKLIAAEPEAGRPQPSSRSAAAAARGGAGGARRPIAIGLESELERST